MVPALQGHYWEWHNDEVLYRRVGWSPYRNQPLWRGSGGISNSENIILRVAFKPTATIRKRRTVNREGEETLLAAKDDTIPVF